MRGEKNLHFQTCNAQPELGGSLSPFQRRSAKKKEGAPRGYCRGKKKKIGGGKLRPPFPNICTRRERKEEEIFRSLGSTSLLKRVNLAGLEGGKRGGRIMFSLWGRKSKEKGSKRKGGSPG